MKTLVERIDEALSGGDRMSAYDLATALWPSATHPQAWAMSSRGGPFAWTRVLGAALVRGKFRVDQVHPGPGGKMIYPRKKGSR